MPTENEFVVASNRGPITWEHDGDDLTPERGDGGLVTALGDAMEGGEGTWVSVALDDADLEVAAEHPDESFEADTPRGSYRIRYVDVGDRLDPHYNVVSNRLLWFTVHGLWGAPYQPEGDDWRDPWHYGYTAVNEAVAQAVVDEASDGAEIHLQDYHLLTAAPTIRKALPDASLLHYIHTPWVGPEYLQMLPDTMVEAMMRSLLSCDLVGLSSPLWSRQFRRCAQEIMGATLEGDAVVHDGRRTTVADFILGIDPEVIAGEADDDAVRAAGEQLDDQLEGRQLVLRADRSDLSKNILRGLLAVETMLAQHPEMVDRVHHMALVKPSRQSVPEYAEYLDRCRQTAERIAERFGDHVITFSDEGDYPKVLAAMQRYDVLLTNPVVDGTNLVAKEGPTLNDNDGAVVLSRTAGAAPVMSAGALMVNPYDVEQTADRLTDALRMSPDERRSRSQTMKEAAARGRPSEWLEAQRHRLAAAVAGR